MEDTDDSSINLSEDGQLKIMKRSKLHCLSTVTWFRKRKKNP